MRTFAGIPETIIERAIEKARFFGWAIDWTKMAEVLHAASDAGLRLLPWTPSTEDEKNVRTWLAVQKVEYPHWVGIVEALLAQPRLPEEPSEGVISTLSFFLSAANNSVLFKGDQVARDCARDAYRALRRHLTKPATKTVEVWHVAYVARDGGLHVNVCGPYHNPEIIAKDEADRLRVLGCTGIKVTGPHQQEVPA